MISLSHMQGLGLGFVWVHGRIEVRTSQEKKGRKEGRKEGR